MNDDYLCDTGTENYSEGGNTSTFFPKPLWDGDVECIGSRTHSSLVSEPPWFFKLLSQVTGDGIEMRVCRDEDTDNEDIAIEIVEIYVH